MDKKINETRQNSLWTALTFGSAPTPAPAPHQDPQPSSWSTPSWFLLEPLQSPITHSSHSSQDHSFSWILGYVIPGSRSEEERAAGRR